MALLETKDGFEALRSANPAFNFAKSVLSGIQRTARYFGELPSLRASTHEMQAFALDDLSPLTSLASSPAISRPGSPTQLCLHSNPAPYMPDFISSSASRDFLTPHAPPLATSGSVSFPTSEAVEENSAIGLPAEKSPSEFYVPRSVRSPGPFVSVDSFLLDGEISAGSNPKAKKPKSAKRKAHDKAASHRNRKKKKGDKMSYIPPANLAAKQVSQDNGTKVNAQYGAESINISSKGYISTGRKGSKKTYYLEELIGPQAKFDFTLKKWKEGKTMHVVDDEGRVLSVCAGHPRNEENWAAVHQKAAELLEEARGKLIFDEKEKCHRRGKFPAVNVGISHGNGQTHPKVLDQSAHNGKILDDLVKDEVFERISGFSTGAFSTWAPRLYEYQNTCLSKLINKDKELRERNEHPFPKEKPLLRNWPRTPWAAAAFNFGPKTVCYKHADYRNLAFGWCAITALGRFDHTKGGHLILWDLKLIIEFPAGATILIPSSAIEHSNVCIHSGETRYSFTQYSAGGIFRWVDNGYKTVEARRSEMTPEQEREHLEQLSHQLQYGLSLYSTLEELQPRLKNTGSEIFHP